MKASSVCRPCVVPTPDEPTRTDERLLVDRRVGLVCEQLHAGLDDDFDRDPEWLDRLILDSQRHGPISNVRIVGRFPAGKRPESTAVSTGNHDPAATQIERADRRPPVSLILPTTDSIDACREVASLLGPDEELLVVCDTDGDPIARAEAELPAAARIVTAGPPAGCSGKANAIAAGLEAAAHDRIVMTDDDFTRPAPWLERLCADYERDGPSSELPVFVGSDPLSRLLEPLYAYGTLGLYRSDVPWGGALIFDRGDIDVAQVCRELRRTVSDDGLLSEHLEVTQHRRLRQVEIGGSLRASLERHVRFMQIFRWFAPRGLATLTAIFGLLAVICVLAPALGVVLTTASTAAVYAVLGVRQWAILWSAVSVVVFVPLLLYALARRTFVWSGRRYRWRGKFDTGVE